MLIRTAYHARLALLSIFFLTACSDGSNSDPIMSSDGQNVPSAEQSPGVTSPQAESPAAPVTPTTPENPPPAPATPTTPSSEENPQPSQPTTPTNDAPSTPQTPVNGEVPELVISNLANGIDASGGDDDSPTQTESYSLVGPFLKDESRPAGPPSVPTGLVALMSSNDWVEFSWVPSVDDQSVEGYEIWRNGSPVFTVRGDTGYEFDYKSWITTSYMDCNYTRYTICESSSPAPGATHQYSVVAIDNEGMRSAPSAPVSITLPAAGQRAVNLDGYQLAFEEEFNGSELSRDVWKTSLPWGPDRTINGERQYFVNLFDNDPITYNPFKFTGSSLQITGVPTPAEDSSNANNLPFLSGVISTQDNFSFTYGYVEMNAKLASGAGLLSTFYLFNQSFEKNQPEIDILEYIGDRPDKAYQTYHYYDSNRSRWATGERHSTPTMEHIAGFNLSSGFHTYGVLWEPELVVWYINNVEIQRITGPRVSDEPMNIIAHLVLGSEWIGEPDPSALPAVLEIDYIKAWQRN